LGTGGSCNRRFDYGDGSLAVFTFTVLEYLAKFARTFSVDLHSRRSASDNIDRA
jgi:hypothetical protein